MSEINRQESEPQEEIKPETEQPQTEMPEDFVEPEGKSGKWGEPVEAGIEVDGKKEKVRYREKVIELPKHRQQETGIKRIRRRELLPPFPEEFCGQTEKGQIYISEDKKFDEIYKYFTNGRYPSPEGLVHVFERGGQARGIKSQKSAIKFINEGLYFQEIFYDEPYQQNHVTLFYDEIEGKKKMVDIDVFAKRHPEVNIHEKYKNGSRKFPCMCELWCDTERAGYPFDGKCYTP